MTFFSISLLNTKGQWVVCLYVCVFMLLVEILVNAVVDVRDVIMVIAMWLVVLVVAKL